jgi:hypothetical protein
MPYRAYCRLWRHKISRNSARRLGAVSWISKAINKYKHQVFGISTPDGVRRVKLRADRNSGGP